MIGSLACPSKVVTTTAFTSQVFPPCISQGKFNPKVSGWFTRAVLHFRSGLLPETGGGFGSRLFSQQDSNAALPTLHQKRNTAVCKRGGVACFVHSSPQGRLATPPASVGGLSQPVPTPGPGRHGNQSLKQSDGLPDTVSPQLNEAQLGRT